MGKTLRILIILTTISAVLGIECKFIYAPLVADDRMHFRDKRSIIKPLTSNTPFECDDVSIDNKSYEAIKTVVGTRGNFDNSTDQFDSPCTANKRNYTPKALNNIYNQGIKIYQSETFVQSIEIEECTNVKSDCSNGSHVAQGYKIICRQHYLKITLKATNEKEILFDEPFYYPSACSCQLVKPKVT